MNARRAWVIIGMLTLLGGTIVEQGGASASATGRHATPPARLADTGLYVRGSLSEVDPSNRPFTPQYPLWSDGLTKRRWVYLPAGSTIDASDPYDWKLPDGTRFWKEFSLNGRRIETRMSWKLTDGEWIFATYTWNPDGTDATLAPADGLDSGVEIAAGRTHALPSSTDCRACHGTANVGPLGFNALQLSDDRDGLAPHAEPLAADMLTLRSLIGAQRIAPTDAYAESPRIRSASPTTRTVLGYLAANCGSCHDGRGGITAAAPVLRLHDLLTDADAVVAQLMDHPTRWQIPGVPEGESRLLHPGSPELSALLRRMQSRSPSSQMPPLGTALRDDAALDALAAWIRDELPRRYAARE